MTFIEWAKTIDWQTINDVCESLDDLNDSQFRFLKGRFIELLVEKYSNGVLSFVGLKHKDFDCKQYNITLELKSEVTNKLYNKKGLKPNFGVRFNNSMGTNKETLDSNHVTDYLIIIKQDGAVLVDKQTILKCTKRHGDGFTLNLTPNDVIELSGKLSYKNKYNLNLKQDVDNLLRSVLTKLNTYLVGDKDVQKT